MGKKVISTTTAALEGHSKPNHITAIGATPTKGIVLVRDANGSKPRCKNGMRSMAMPTAKPRPEPSTQPKATARTTVCTKSVCSVPMCSPKAAAIRLGAGSSTRGTSKATVSNCQKYSSQPPNSSADALAYRRGPSIAARRRMPLSASKAMTNVAPQKAPSLGVAGSASGASSKAQAPPMPASTTSALMRRSGWAVFAFISACAFQAPRFLRPPSRQSAPNRQRPTSPARTRFARFARSSFR